MGADDDSVFINYTGGSNRMIEFDGGEGSDLIRLIGGDPSGIGVYTVVSADEGLIQYTIGANTQTIDFSGLEPIEDLMTADSLTINASTSGDTIRIIDGPVVMGDRTTEVNLDGAFELIRFANKTDVTVNADAGDDIVTLDNPNPATGLANLVIQGGADENTLVAGDSVNLWEITGTSITNTGTLNRTSFSDFQNLTGGADEDTFVFDDAAAVAGRIDGGAGTDTLDYSAYVAVVVVDLGIDPETIAGIATGTLDVIRIETWIDENGVLNAPFPAALAAPMAAVPAPGLPPVAAAHRVDDVRSTRSNSESDAHLVSWANAIERTKLSHLRTTRPVSEPRDQAFANFYPVPADLRASTHADGQAVRTSRTQDTWNDWKDMVDALFEEADDSDHPASG